MFIRSKYQITFQKITNHMGRFSYCANQNSNSYGQVAFHLENSSLDNTQDQITDINNIVNDYQAGLPYDDFWGDIAGSQLFVYPESNTVELGNSTLPINDFLQLLQEWKMFLAT